VWNQSSPTQVLAWPEPQFASSEFRTLYSRQKSYCKQKFVNTELRLRTESRFMVLGSCNLFCVYNEGYEIMNYNGMQTTQPPTTRWILVGFLQLLLVQALMNYYTNMIPEKCNERKKFTSILVRKNEKTYYTHCASA